MRLMAATVSWVLDNDEVTVTARRVSFPKIPSGLGFAS
jgi:hypothetical protein